MSELKVSPGAAADSAFQLGMISAAVVGLVALGALYWTGEFGLAVLGFTLVLGFPVYLIVVASALSVWLGFDKDATDLRPVYREKKQP